MEETTTETVDTETTETVETTVTDGQEAAETAAEVAEEVKPVEYVDFTLPEGMTLDAALLEKFTPIAKELNLTQEQAQKFVDMRVEEVKAQAEAFESQKTAWKKETENNPEIGGSKLADTLAYAGKVMDKYGSDELKSVMNDYGIGNHPALVSLFAKIGRDMSEDTLPVSATHTTNKTAEEVLNSFYPTMNK